MIAENTPEIDFDELELCLEIALLRVPVASPCELSDLISPEAAAGRPLFLCELIKLDMCKASDCGLRRYLDFYEPILQEEFPDGCLPLDLVLEEIQIQRQLGELPRSSELQLKYPHLAHALDGMLTHSESIVRQAPSNIPASFLDGEKIDDFDILRTLGQGAFARVYLARQVSMQRLVALKVSFHRSDESIVLSQLDHANVVRVYDQRPVPESSATMLYMQYVPGGTLSDVIQRIKDQQQIPHNGEALLESINAALLAAGQQVNEDSPIQEQLRRKTWGEVVATLGYQLALGLAHAHDQSVMHRDIKPANILLTIDGVPKLADFNVSFAADAGSNAAAHFGGSIAYMSPEQLNVISPSQRGAADELDKRSDLYALALVLWELWQSRRAWQADTVVTNWNDAVQQQLEIRKKPLVTTRPAKLPIEFVLEKTLRISLAWSRDERPLNCYALAAKLKTALNPTVAHLFEPPTHSWQSWLVRLPAVLVTAIIVFVPNGIACVINFEFNESEVSRNLPELLEYFGFVSLMINAVAFTFGVLLHCFIILPIQQSVRKSSGGQTASQPEINQVWRLGFQSALLGGVLWFIAGLVFPITLGWVEPRFRFAESASFFLSLAGCGAMACIYPFFGLSLLSLQAFYPVLISHSMNDPGLTKRVRRLRARANCFLFAAALVPLTLLGMFLLVPELPRLFQGLCLLSTAIGLVISFLTHQRLLTLCQVFLEVVDEQ